MLIPASSNASFAAATAYCEKGSILFAALKSMRSFATKSFTSAAICTLNSEASNFVIGPIPTLPSLIPVQNSSTVFPIGVTAPRPVTTTLLFSISKSIPFRDKDFHPSLVSSKPYCLTRSRFPQNHAPLFTSASAKTKFPFSTV